MMDDVVLVGRPGRGGHVLGVADMAVPGRGTGVLTGTPCRQGFVGAHPPGSEEVGMPTVAVGCLNIRDVMDAIRQEADRAGLCSRACLISPCLIGLQDSDLARLTARPRSDVHYDGHRLWVRGLDFQVHR
ncbi:MAG TPA: hypothetical protein VI248_05800 [Kineosporiaceae bacterium]